MNEYNGVIIMNKPVGISSHACVGIARRALGMKKIGHTGTLDPLASGVLPLLVGKSTRAADFLSAKDKCYRATILLGKRTDTLDVTGKVLEEKEVNVREEKVKEVINSFVGEIEQLPPMYSAISVGGQRLYSLARQGIEIERKTRKITIFSIDIEKIELPRVVINVHASKGTYIRTLCDDIGKALGSLGCMETLCRTKCGMFDIESSVTPEDLKALFEKGEGESVILPIDGLFSEYREIVLDKKRADRVKNGVPIFYDAGSMGEIFRVYDENHSFVSLSKSDKEEDRPCLRLVKGFY